MPIDPTQAGFTWPEETTLTAPNGETMIVRPLAVDFTALQESTGRRVEECYRYYTSTRGTLTELEVKRWLAGGDDACARLLAAFTSCFGSGPGTRVPLTDIIAALEDQGFHENTITINFRWLLQDGYVAAHCEADNWILELVSHGSA